MNENKRIEYIDCMRGFTMILVVACHVAAYCLGISDFTPSFHPVLYEFRMPLFFFISGFVLYREGVAWNLSHVASFLIKKKFPVQIITTFIFFLVYIKINNISLLEGVFSESKEGYWFTYMLFIYFCVYSICRFVFYRFNCTGLIADIVILTIGFLFYMFFFVKSIYYSLPIDEDIKNLLSLHHWGYYLFFSIGTLSKKHFTKVQMLLDAKATLLICLVVFFGLNLYYNELLDSHVNFLYLTTAITGIAIVFSFFRIHQALFSKETFIGRNLQFIGRRTLDIYLLHYLLLPLNLKVFFAPLSEYPVPVIEFSITIFISLIVVAGCLLISSILRMSPILAYLLFGVKNKSQNH